MHAHLFDFIHDTIVVAVRCQAAARSQPKVLLAQSIPTVHVTRPSLRCLEESFEKLADWTVERRRSDQASYSWLQLFHRRASIIIFYSRYTCSTIITTELPILEAVIK